MTKAIEIMEPHIAKEEVAETLGTVVLGTVEGDIHDIGKRIVATMLKVYGFEVHDLGRDVPSTFSLRRPRNLNRIYWAPLP
jgi:methanogenic corrinoid protein MtbC1